MGSLVSVLGDFLYFLAAGSFCCLPVASIKLTGKGFWRLIASLNFGFLILAVAFSLSASSANSLISLIGLLVVNFLIYFFVREEKWYWNTSFYLTGLCFIIYNFVGLSDFYLDHFFTLGLVGVTFYAMILGHYYLVVPKLSVRPLIILHFLLWAFLIFKIIVSVKTYFAFEQDFSLWDQVFIWMRFLWGYVALGALSFFSFRLSQMRSTQSATGVLYVSVFFMVVGEIVAIYLKYKGYPGL
jgi:hypothetical protein